MSNLSDAIQAGPPRNCESCIGRNARGRNIRSVALLAINLPLGCTVIPLSFDPTGVGLIEVASKVVTCAATRARKAIMNTNIPARCFMLGLDTVEKRLFRLNWRSASRHGDDERITACCVRSFTNGA